MPLENPSLNKIQSKFEKELGGETSDEVWNNALLWVNGISSCARLNLIQLKVPHPIHFQ